MLKSKKIIKVVDISADDVVIQPINTIAEEVDIEKPTIESEEVDIEKQTVDAHVVDTQEAPIEIELKKIVKTSDLTECPKCHKMIMNKTLKYSHFKTCCIVKNTKIISPPDVVIQDNVPIIKPLNDITANPTTIKKPITAIRAKSTVIKPVKSVITNKPPIIVDNPQPIITLEEMRRQYYDNAKQQRIQRIQNIFSNAI